MKYTLICLFICGCGSVTAEAIVSPDADLGQVDAGKVSADSGGSGGAASIDAGIGGTLAGSGGSPAVSGSGGAQGSGGSPPSTGGSTGSGGSGSGGTMAVDSGTPPSGNLACGLSLPTCSESVDFVYYDMAYPYTGGPVNTTGPREPKICAVNADGVTVTDDKDVFRDVRCGFCTISTGAKKHEVYNCLIKANTMVGVEPTSMLPIKTDTAIFCLPINGKCPDTGVQYTKWNGPDSI